MPDHLKNLKEELLSFSRRFEEAGLCLYKSGNFSFRDPESGFVVITASGVDRMTAGTADLCVLTPDGDVVEAEKGRKPSMEAPLHLRAYSLRADVFCVAHTHSRYATVMAILQKEIPPIVTEAAIYGGGRIPVAPPAAPGTSALADSVNAFLPEHDVCLLAAHGLLAVGSDPESTWLKTLYAEEVAWLYYAVLTAGGEPGAQNFRPRKSR